MANNSLSLELAQEAVDAVAQYGEQQAAANALGLSRSTFQSRLRVAQQRRLKPSPGIEDPNNLDHLKGRIQRLEAELSVAQKKQLDEAMVRRQIIGLAEATENAAPPKWTVEAKGPDSLPGVPTLFVSDLHWGEEVHESQISGSNRYDVKIAKERMKRLANRAVRLLRIIDQEMRYPGIVIILGGDMISGNIHDELTATNQLNSMPAVLDLFETLTAFLEEMANVFGHVFIPAVSGNHGRDTRKIWNKDRHHTSFDWLLYCFLQKRFVNDKRITFLIPDGPDAYYKVFNHRYLLSHGDQFRGGDGMIGALGPIIRGDHKKRSRNAQIDMEYDTMCIGHFHQYIHHGRVIVNGSLKGYDEYAYNNNFGFEAPQQALWLTHPTYGITYRMPVYVDKIRNPAKTAWVSVAS